MANLLDCQELIVKSYLSYLGEGFEVVEYRDGLCQIITPYWRPDGDHIEIFVKSGPSGATILTDEGQTLDWLFSAGVDVESSDTYQGLIERLTSQYGVTLMRGVLSIQSDASATGKDIHRFLTSIRAISHLILLQRQHGKPTFKDEMELFLIENNQHYTSGFKVKGKTVEHTIDFHLNSRRNMLVETLTASSIAGARNMVRLVAFQWIDIREAGWDYEKVTVLDDTGEKWEHIWRQDKIRLPLEVYSDRIVRWSQRAVLIQLPLS